MFILFQVSDEVHSFNGEIQQPSGGIAVTAEHTLLGVTDDNGIPYTGNIFEITLQSEIRTCAAAFPTAQVRGEH
jgi:hypothetical protein